MHALRALVLAIAATSALASSSAPPGQRQPPQPRPHGSASPYPPPPEPQAQPTAQPGFGSPTAAGADDQALQFCVDEANRYRAQHGKAPVARSAQLEAFAAEGAREDHQAQRAHGPFSRTGGGGLSFAENECPGWSGWSVAEGGVVGVMRECFTSMMNEGPPPAGSFNHYSNMLGEHTTLGCGIYLPGDGTVTVVQDFGG
jgi:hypothetical protein